MNKITRKTKGITFNDLIEDFEDFSKYEHRKSSTFYAKAIITINEEFYPNIDRMYDGYWETNEFIHSEIDCDKNEITELNRVEKAERVITQSYWKLVEN